jgi:hypothetical protein
MISPFAKQVDLTLLIFLSILLAKVLGLPLILGAQRTGGLVQFSVDALGEDNVVGLVSLAWAGHDSGDFGWKTSIENDRRVPKKSGAGSITSPQSSPTGCYITPGISGNERENRSFSN